jgi:protein TonB
MPPNTSDDILFRGIPTPRRRSARFLTSFTIHIAATVLILLAVPQIVLQAPALRIATLVAPFQPAPLPKIVPPPVVIAKAPAPSVALRPLPRPAALHLPQPKLEDAPPLPPTPRLATMPPALVQTAAVRPPIQTGVFGSSVPPQTVPPQALPAARDAGFDRAPTDAPAAKPTTIASAGFDTRSADVHAPAASAAIQTGAFAQAAAGPRGAQPASAGVGRTAFDVQSETGKRATPDQVRKTGFDQPKAVNAPAKPAAPAAVTIRPLEILDKPKPAYTAEARNQKIEGTVLLDVIFAATGEVRVLGVVHGLGHGLDESAIDAARHIRFTPATQAGSPVDQHVTLHILFQITG